MGFFDKMFEKKECAICGTELGLLGKTKINEGYLCKECVGKLSPFFGGYRSSTADDIREQGPKNRAACPKIRRRQGSAKSVPDD